MKRDVLVYISGPMTAKDGRTAEQNCADGIAVYLELLTLGIPAFCPHLSGLAPSAWTTLTHEQWIAYDCAILDRCTHILMMPRWETSTGAVKEREYWLSTKGFCREDAVGMVAYSVAELREMVGVERDA